MNSDIIQSQDQILHAHTGITLLQFCRLGWGVM